MKLDRVIAVRNDKTVYRDDERVVKVFISGYKKSDVLNEALNQARMEEIGLPVPGVIEVSELDEKWAIVSEYKNGKTLSRLIFENPERTTEYMDMFVELQNMIHSKTCPELTKLSDKLNRKISEADIDVELKRKVFSYHEAMPDLYNVCHGDFYPSNVIVDDGSLYVIDWSHATCGSRFADIAKTYISFLTDEKESMALLYLDNICKNNHSDIQEVKKWLPIVAAAELSGNRRNKYDLLISLIDGCNK